MDKLIMNKNTHKVLDAEEIALLTKLVPLRHLKVRAHTHTHTHAHTHTNTA